MASKRVQRDIHDLDVEMAHCECLVSRALKSKAEKTSNAKLPRPKSVATRCHHILRSDHAIPVTTADIVSSKTVSRGTTPVKCRNGINYFEEVLDGKNSIVSVTVKTKAGKDSNLKRTSSTQVISTKGKLQESKSQNRDPPRKIDNHVRLNNKVVENPTKLTSQLNEAFGAAEKPKHLTWSKRLQEQGNKMEANKKALPLANEPRRNIRSSSRNREMPQLSTYTSNYVGGFIKPEDGKQCATDVSSITGSQRSCHRNMSDIDELLYVNHNMRSNQQSSTSVRPVVSNMTNITAVSSFNSSGGDFVKDFSMINPVRLLNFLVKELDGKLESRQTAQPDLSTRQLIREIELTLKRIPADDDAKNTAEEKPRAPSTPPKSPPVAVPNSPPVRDSNSQLNSLHRHFEKTCSQAESAVIRVEQACEQLRNDKKRLEEEISGKQKELDKALQNEKDYLRAVGSLKTSLEAMTKKCDDYAKTIASLTDLGSELRDENKVIPVLRAAQQKLNHRLEESTRENERLTTQVHLAKLEQEKLVTLLADSTNELARVRREVTDIHRLVADQLETLKTPPKRADNRIGKLDRKMVALNRHGWTSTSGSEASAPSDQRLPVTSSPTSSCNSSMTDKGVYQSWQKISNISNFDPNAVQNSIFREVGATVEIALDGGELVEALQSNTTPLDKSNAFHSLYLSMSDSTSVSVGKLPGSPTHKSSRQLREDLNDLFAEIKKKSKKGLNIKLASPPTASKDEKVVGDASFSSAATNHS